MEAGGGAQERGGGVRSEGERGLGNVFISYCDYLSVGRRQFLSKFWANMQGLRRSVELDL
jgi:hypothetical protein